MNFHWYFHLPSLLDGQPLGYALPGGTPSQLHCSLGPARGIASGRFGLYSVVFGLIVANRIRYLIDQTTETAARCRTALCYLPTFLVNLSFYKSENLRIQDKRIQRVGVFAGVEFNVRAASSVLTLGICRFLSMWHLNTNAAKKKIKKGEGRRESIDTCWVQRGPCVFDC